MANRLRLRTAERLAELFNQHGVRYAVVNGLYFYPRDIGRDLDVVIHPDDVLLAVWLAEQVRKAFGWEYLYVRQSHHGVYQLFYVHKRGDQVEWLEVDLMHDSRNLVLGVSGFIDVNLILNSKTEHRGPFRVSILGEYFKAYLRPVYYGDVRRFKERYPLTLPQTSELHQALRDIFGNSLYEDYINMVSNSSLEELAEWSRGFKWRLNLHYIRVRPFTALKNLLWTRFVRPLLLYLFNPGLLIAVVGPDGVGKSTAIKEAVKYLDGLFDIRIRHWRPGILPAPSALVGKGRQNLNDLPNRTRPTVVEHWIRIVYYWLDFTFGYLLKDRFPPKSVIQLVLYDRHALDTAVDPVRYRLAFSLGTEMLYRFAPRPDKVILLKDSPERILQRKRELSKKELHEQLQKWEELAKRGLVDAQIQTGASPEETGRQIALEILKTANERFDLRRNRIWQKAVSRFGFRNVLVKGVYRISFPWNVTQRGWKQAQRLYQPYGRWERWIYQLWWRMPIPNRWLRFDHTEGPPRVKQFDWMGWIEEVEKVLGMQQLKPIFYFPPQQDRFKTSVLLLDQDERPVSIAKVALDGRSREALEREEVALSYLANLQVESFAYPSLIGQGCFRGIPYILYGAIKEANPGPSKWVAIYQKAWQELRDKSLHRKPLEPFLEGLSEQWREVISYLEAQSLDKSVLCCAVHGDFASWNALKMDGKLVLIDWEEFSPSAPYLTDVVHFFISWLLLCEKKEVGQVVKSILEWAGKDSVPDIILALVYLAQCEKLSEETALALCNLLIQ